MTTDEMEIVKSMIVGVITGAFSGGTMWGIFKIEIKFLRRDIDEVRHYLWGDRRHHENPVDAARKIS